MQSNLKDALNLFALALEEIATFVLIKKNK